MHSYGWSWRQMCYWLVKDYSAAVIKATNQQITSNLSTFTSCLGGKNVVLWLAKFQKTLTIDCQEPVLLTHGYIYMQKVPVETREPCHNDIKQKNKFLWRQGNHVITISNKRILEFVLAVVGYRRCQNTVW